MKHNLGTNILKESNKIIMSGADMVLHVLSQEHVNTIFGYSGGAILPTYDAIFRYNESHDREPEKQIRLIVPANEQGAGFMAAGYARASGNVGVCLVTSGPGATNTVTPVRDCMADSIPMVLISGQVARAAIGTDAFQEASVFNIMSACAKHVFLVTDPLKLEATLRTAFEIARTGRPGPVVVDIPKDIQNWIGEYQGGGVLELKGYRDRMKSQQVFSRMLPQKADAFFDLLENSHRPLVYAGGGVINSNSGSEFKEFIERYRIPVVTTLMGIGSLSTTHALNYHMLGMHGTAYANYAVEDCDLLIAIGARFDDRVVGNPHKFAPNARAIAQIDIDPSEICKVKNADWHHVGDIRSTLRSLCEHKVAIGKDYSAWHVHLQSIRSTHRMDFDRESELIQPYYVIEELNRITNGDAIITTGVGQHQMWAAQYCEFRGSRMFLTSGGMGTMGFGLPAAIGAQVANPERLVIDIDGDGSLRMNFGEMETATTYNLPVKVLLFNNFGDGMVRQWQKLYFSDRFSGSDKSLHRKNFVKSAEADGFEFAKRITKNGEVTKALAEFISFQGPAFLEVIIDPDAGVYPMVGPGQPYSKMVTGPFIMQREQGVAPTDELPYSIDKSDMF